MKPDSENPAEPTVLCMAFCTHRIHKGSHGKQECGKECNASRCREPFFRKQLLQLPAEHRNGEGDHRASDTHPDPKPQAAHERDNGAVVELSGALWQCAHV